MSLPLTEIIEELKATPDSVLPILSTLHRERLNLDHISKVDLAHLCSRTLNLCKSNDPQSIWKGTNIIYILCDSSEVLSGNGNAFFSQLLKILASTHSNNSLVLDSTIECLNKLGDSIRGKPTLTREILTPNLNGVFGGLLERFDQNPRLVLSSLKKLIQEHPTTSRPFANKLKMKILAFVSKPEFNGFPRSLKAEACSTLSCLPIIEKEGPDQHWLNEVAQLASNIANTMEIYTNFLNVNDDEDTIGQLRSLSEWRKEDIFPALNIDVNIPSTIFSISQRVHVLFQLLEGYLISGTRFTVTVPIGKVIALIELVFAVNTKYIPFKRELRDINVRKYIERSLVECHESALTLLSQLPSKYGGSLLPHMTNILASLESLIFLQQRRLDHSKILDNEPMVCNILSCANNWLSLVSYFQDYSALSRIVETAVFLIQPRVHDSKDKSVSNKQNQKQHSKSSKKSARRGGAVPLADLLSHEHLFNETVPESTKNIVLDFFSTIISRAQLASTQYNKLLKYVIVEAIKQSGLSYHSEVPENLKRVIVSSVLHPGPESASILPIATTILADSKLLSVFNAPRFPPMPTVITNPAFAEHPEEESEDDSQDKPIAFEQQIKRFKANDYGTALSTQRAEEEQKTPVTNAENIFTTKSFKSEQENQEDLDEVKIQNDVEIKKESKSENSEAPTKHSFTQEAPTESNKELELESDGGSEIEIPDLDLEEDSEEEK